LRPRAERGDVTKRGIELTIFAVCVVLVLSLILFAELSQPHTSSGASGALAGAAKEFGPTTFVVPPTVTSTTSTTTTTTTTSTIPTTTTKPRTPFCVAAAQLNNEFATFDVELAAKNVEQMHIQLLFAVDIVQRMAGSAPPQIKPAVDAVNTQFQAERPAVAAVTTLAEINQVRTALVAPVQTQFQLMVNYMESVCGTASN
jgi:hypothetical protein